MRELYHYRIAILFMIAGLVWQAVVFSTMSRAQQPQESDLVPLPADVVQALTAISASTSSVVLRNPGGVSAEDVNVQLRNQQEQLKNQIAAIRIPAAVVPSVRAMAMPYTEGPPSDTRISTSAVLLIAGVFQGSQRELWEAKKRDDEQKAEQDKAKEAREKFKLYGAGVVTALLLLLVGWLVLYPPQDKDKGKALIQVIVGGVIGFWLKAST